VVVGAEAEEAEVVRVGAAGPEAAAADLVAGVAPQAAEAVPAARPGSP